MVVVGGLYRFRVSGKAMVGIRVRVIKVSF